MTMGNFFYTVWCFFLIILLVPLYVVCAGLILFCSGFPILFRQKRVGKDGKIFLMYKFRTMEAGAEKKQSLLKKKNEADGPVFKIYNDPRYTPVGKFLSHTGLDELPQFWNVLKGDMAFIGPRPLPVDEARTLTRWQRKRQNVKPGIISPWILDGYHSKPFSAWMKSDIVYTKKKSFRYDTYLIGKTIPFFLQLCMNELFSLKLKNGKRE